MEKFIVTPKEDKSVTMTIRIDRALQEEYNDLAAKTNRSRNELISMALQYALDPPHNPFHFGRTRDKRYRTRYPPRTGTHYADTPSPTPTRK